MSLNIISVCNRQLKEPQRQNTLIVICRLIHRPIHVSVLDATVYYITANAAANMTFNLIGNTTTPLDNLVQAGQAITTVFIITQGAIQYSANIAIDGVFRAANTRWLGNSRPAYVLSGGISANNLDVYSFTTIKTTGNTYTILGSNTVFGAT